MAEPLAPRERIERLERFALERLPAMRLPDGAFCYEVRAPGLVPEGRSARYGLIVCLGLQRARAAGLDVGVDPDELLAMGLRELDAGALSLGDMGLLLWACARGEGTALDKVAFRIHGRVGGGLPDLEGLELSWLVTGAADAGADALLDLAIARQLERVDERSGLFRHRDAGSRARFPNFATQIYGVLALARAARAGRDGALGVACRAADRLLELQRPDGGWPWLFDARRGCVVEPYEVYSVHQDAMAPMALLELHEQTGEERYRAAAVRGMAWVFGENELGRPMLDAEQGILHRSIRRRPPRDRAWLYANTGLAVAGLPTASGRGRALELNRTDRPYHLGWVLEAWAGREALAASLPQ